MLVVFGVFQSDCYVCIVFKPGWENFVFGGGICRQKVWIHWVYVAFIKLVYGTIMLEFYGVYIVFARRECYHCGFLVDIFDGDKNGLIGFIRGRL